MLLYNNMCAAIHSTSSILPLCLQELGGNATMLFYMTEEGNEGRQAYLERRAPDFSKFKRLP